ncbi:hypothetical protein, variant [Phialophora macrospora]|uniref:C2H2-type domain-containing protein n=1 Tax=Phialophora macrospora TaxID=1851006 RepID=A0A0D2FAE1_9EURO|nr:hypothetical protein, variant [Phialophora macrospora]
MSYPPLLNYGNHYDSNQDQRNQNNSYNISRNPYAKQASYPGDIGHSRYGSSGYDGQAQSQRQDYSSGPRQRSTYGNDCSNDMTTQRQSQEDWTQVSNYATQAAAGNSGHNYYSSSASSSQNTQGLNNLAYASGLDDAGLQRHGQHVQRSNAVSGSGYSTSSGSHMLDRAQWSAATPSTLGHNPTSSNYSYQNDSSSSQTQSNSLSAAAAALAGAVNARFSQATRAMGGNSSNSPVLESSTSMQPPVSNRSASPSYPPHSATTRPQRRQSQSPSQSSQRASNVGTYQHRAQSTTPGQHGQASSQNPPSRGSQNNAQPVNTISNLITPSVNEPFQNEYLRAGEPQAMPSYVDPTQVFNPYAKEHERRRREAAAQAEAEARNKAEEEAAAKRNVEQAATTAAEKKKDQQKAAMARKAQSSQQQKQPTTANNTHAPRNEPAGIISSQSDQASTDVTADEPSMAAELKAMMEKMKEFRSKDPGLFQKLWDDMRKPVSGPSSAVPLESPSPQMVLQQTVPPAGTQAYVQSGQQHQTTPESMTAMPSGLKRSQESDAPADIPRPVRMNGYKVTVLNNPENLPDLGRFPAERRFRLRYSKPPSESAAQPATAQPAVANQSPTVSNQETPAPPPRPQAGATPEPPAGEIRPLIQALPTKGPASGTIWPEDKRKALADAAIVALKAVPENASISITPTDIHGMLEQNPSYIDLCELLEKKGLKFHRGQFARQLLNNVPYLNGPSSKPLPTRSSPPQKRNAGPSIPVQAIMVPPTVATISTGAPDNPGNIRFQAVNGGVTNTVVKSEKSFFPPKLPSGVALQVPRPRQSRLHPLARPEPPPGSKEAMARKRDFSELVDLTALSDNEDYVMSKKQARVDSPSPELIDPFQQFQESQVLTNAQRPQAMGQHPAGPPRPMQNGMLEEPLRFDPTQPPYPQSYAPLPHYPAAQPGRLLQAPSPTPAQQRPFKCLAKPINKLEALRKTSYDAKTVARDLLIAVGRHPTERQLNAHLAGLLGKYIEIDSDLSTFEWDAIDPGGPPVPQVPYVDIPTGPPRLEWARGGRPKLEAKTEAYPARLPDSDRRQLPAPAAGGERAPPARREEKPGLDKARPQKSPVQVNTDLGPSHIVRRGPGRPPREPNRTPNSTPNSVVHEKRKPRSVVSLDERLASEHKRSRRTASSRLTPTVTPSTNSAKRMEVHRTHASGKRVGRPPKSQNMHPASGALERAVTQISQMGVSVPPKPISATNPVFRCRWKGCQAHLHNLETLRNHVSKVHHPTSEELKNQNGYVCWWRKCKLLVEDEDGKLGPSQIFDRRGDWLEHVKESHLKEVAQKLGDGPSLKHIDDPPG